MKSLIASLLFCFTAIPAFCAEIYLSPERFTRNVGATIVFNLYPSLSSPSGPQLIGAYDLTLHYDPKMLGLQQVTFSNLIGIPGVDSIATSSVTDVDANHELLRLVLVSFLTEQELFTRFLNEEPTLALLSLKILSNAYGSITITGDVSDPFGNPVPITFGSASNIPEPNTAGIVLVGLLLLAASRLRCSAAA